MDMGCVTLSPNTNAMKRWRSHHSIPAVYMQLDSRGDVRKSIEEKIDSECTRNGLIVRN